MKLDRYMTVGVASLCCVNVAYADQRIVCPARLPAEVLQSTSDGWSLYVSREMSLSEGGMLHGAPDQSAYLAPYEARRATAGKRIVTTQRWTFLHPYAFPRGFTAATVVAVRRSSSSNR